MTTTVSQVHSEAIPQRARHIDVAYHHVRKLSNDKVVQVKWVSTKDQMADVLTKPVTKQVIERFKTRMVELISSRSEGSVENN